MLRQFCIASVILFSFHLGARAANDSTRGSVIVETPEDYTLSYKDRRNTHGALFSLFSEVFDPVSYQSGFGDAYIGDLFDGVEFRLNGIELGYKYNVSVGSLAALYSYSTGGGAKGGRSLKFTKQSFSANATLDAYFDEPWVAPYGQLSMNLFNISEEKSLQPDFSEETSPIIGYRYGLLFQLDWLENYFDPDAKGQRISSSGIECTYVDIYYANYIAGSNAQDVNTLGGDGEGNLESSGQMGIGLKMEF